MQTAAGEAQWESALHQPSQHFVNGDRFTAAHQAAAEQALQARSEYTQNLKKQGQIVSQPRNRRRIVVPSNRRIVEEALGRTGVNWKSGVRFLDWTGLDWM